MGKRLFAVITVLLIMCVLCAKAPVYPVDSVLGQCVPSDSSEQHILVSEALSEPYSFEWAEKYLHPRFKKNIALIYSPLLSEILPAESVLYSRASISSDGTYAISVKIAESGKIISFAVSEGFISAILN